MVRLLLADEHEVVREGLRHILQVRPGWEVVAEAADGREAVRKAVESDVAIVDYCLSLCRGHLHAHAGWREPLATARESGGGVARSAA